MTPLLTSAASLVLAAAAAAGPAVAPSAGTPYEDPSAQGRLTFCDAGGRAVTSGSTTDAPFAALTTSSLAAPAPYDGATALATLVFKQPRAGVAAGAWSGETVGAGSRFPDPQHPTAATTEDAVTVGEMVEDFPPQLDGLLQVRLYLSSPDTGVRSSPYAATSIRVTGTTWTAVDPGDASCAGARATSVSTLLGITPSPRSSGAAPASSPAAPTAAAERSTATAGPAPSAEGGAAPAAAVTSATGPTATASASGHERPLLAVGAFGLTGLALLATAAGSRRRAAERAAGPQP